jgi:small neutral amino acid transporter SnatA (MarC family)
MVDSVLSIEFITGAIISIIVISNPLSTSAIFIALTEKMTPKQKQDIIKIVINGIKDALPEFIAIAGS